MWTLYKMWASLTHGADYWKERGEESMTTTLTIKLGSAAGTKQTISLKAGKATITLGTGAAMAKAA